MADEKGRRESEDGGKHLNVNEELEHPLAVLNGGTVVHRHAVEDAVEPVHQFPNEHVPLACFRLNMRRTSRHQTK